jgi:hypothetical protein
LKTLLRLLSLTLGSALLAAALLALRCPTLPTTVGSAALDGGLENALEQALIKQVNPAELSEQSINATLAAQATPAAAGEEQPQLSCTLQEGECSLYLSWQLMGQPVVARVDLAVRREGGVFVVDVLRGAYGHLQVPRGLLMPLRPVLETLRQQHAAELAALFAIPRFRFAPGKLVLAPKF